MDNEKYLRILLGVLDTIHDFHKLDEDINTKCNFSIINNFIDFVLLLEPDVRTIYREYTQIFDKTNLHRVDKSKFKKEFYIFLLSKVIREGKPIKELNNTIINNFKKVFDLEGINILNIITDDTILYLRTPLYYLIESYNKNDNINFNIILDFLLNFLDITNLKNITSKIISNISSIRDNITYPRTYFDDITTSNNLIAFKILNADKLIIDESSVEGISKYLSNKKRVLYINDNNSALNFHINRDIDIIDFLGAKYYIKDNLLYSEFENIIFRLKRNFVGRGNTSDDDYGIYQLICSLLNIINDFNTEYINNNFTNIITEINETINIITEFNTYLINNKFLFIKISKRIFNIKKELDKIDWNKYLDINAFILLYNNIFNIIEMIKINKSILLTENILTEIEYSNIINLIKNTNIYLIYKLYNLFTDDNNGLISNIFSINGIKSLFLLKIIKHSNLNKMKDIIEISDLEEILYKIFIKYNTLEIIHKFICFLLVGAKRYADWIQAFIGKRHYFFVQTTDYYCAYYSLLIKGPVIINIKNSLDKDLDNLIVYNFRQIPEFNESYIKSNFGIITKGINDYNINNVQNNLLYFRNKYSDTDFVKTPNLSRNYFYKYIKYKTKYNKLKKLII